MTTKKVLVSRWSEEPGRSILGRVHAFLQRTQQAGHGQPSGELFELLDGLPHREEVPDGRDLRGAELGGGTRELDLAGCDFQFAKLTLNLAQCDLRGARFDDVSAGNGVITGRLDGASFARAKLRGTFFQGVTAHGCCFDDAVLAGANFAEADLTGTTFRNADCRRAKFLRATLAGCDLRGARLDEAVLQGVVFDDATDLRGASLVNVYDRELRDRAGNLVAAATDWSRARRDDTAAGADGPDAATRELIDAALRLAPVNPRPWTAAAIAALEQARASATGDAWHEQLMKAVPSDARPEVDALLAEAMRSLL